MNKKYICYLNQLKVNRHKHKNFKIYYDICLQNRIKNNELNGSKNLKLGGDLNQKNEFQNVKIKNKDDENETKKMTKNKNKETTDYIENLVKHENQISQLILNLEQGICKNKHLYI